MNAGRKSFWDNLADVDEVCFFVLACGKIPGRMKLASGTLAAWVAAGPVHPVEAARDHRPGLEECFYEGETFLIEEENFLTEAA